MPSRQGIKTAPRKREARPPDGGKRLPPRYLMSCFEWAEALTAAAVLIVLIFTFVVQVVAVDGSSMRPSLESGDRVLVSGLFYQPQPGDIVVLRRAAGTRDPLVKRVIAVAGQEVDIDGGTVWVDGAPLDESAYTENGTTFLPLGGVPVEFPQVVPEGHVFVLGDNREISKDSRVAEVGMVDERYVIGRAMAVVFPFNRIKGL